MNCLCCGKPLRSENPSSWHKSCIRRFFDTGELPGLEITEKEMEVLALEATNKGYSVPGVQKKLSLHLFSGTVNPRLTLVNYPSGYILKPQVADFQALPEAEHLVMCMAKEVGIATVPHALFRGKDALAYITKRIDRISTKDGSQMLAMEDFCQLDYRLTQDKYKGSYERCAKIIERHSSRAGVDMTEFYIRLLFCFVVGNSDMHLKNFSLIETVEGSGTYILSAAYDLLPVNVLMPEDSEQFALTMNGKRKNLHRNDFLKFADSCGIERHVAERLIQMMISKKSKLIAMTRQSFMPEDMQEDLIRLIEERIAALTK